MLVSQTIGYRQYFEHRSHEQRRRGGHRPRGTPSVWFGQPCASRRLVTASCHPAGPSFLVTVAPRTSRRRSSEVPIASFRTMIGMSTAVRSSRSFRLSPNPTRTASSNTREYSLRRAATGAPLCASEGDVVVSPFGRTPQPCAPEGPAEPGSCVRVGDDQAVRFVVLPELGEPGLRERKTAVLSHGLDGHFAEGGDFDAQPRRGPDEDGQDLLVAAPELEDFVPCDVPGTRHGERKHAGRHVERPPVLRNERRRQPQLLLESLQFRAGLARTQDDGDAGRLQPCHGGIRGGVGTRSVVDQPPVHVRDNHEPALRLHAVHPPPRTPRRTLPCPAQPGSSPRSV